MRIVELIAHRGTRQHGKVFDFTLGGGLDEIELVDARSGRRYAHAAARDEWSKVDLSPSIAPKLRAVE